MVGTTSAGTSAHPFGYTGRRWDPDLNLYYYRARWYDPQLGTFLETDPIGSLDYINLYSYVGLEPGNKTDPTGLRGRDLLPSPAERDARRAQERRTREFLNNVVRQLPSGIGSQVGGQLETGLPLLAGVVATGSFGSGYFFDPKTGRLTAAAYTSNGAAAYFLDRAASLTPERSPTGVLGASTGVGWSGYVTNARTAADLAGPFSTTTYAAGVGPIQGAVAISSANGIYQINICPPFAGLTAGGSTSNVTTNTTILFSSH
jgi:RHS repeat-associated protein